MIALVLSVNFLLIKTVLIVKQILFQITLLYVLNVSQATFYLTSDVLNVYILVKHA